LKNLDLLKLLIILSCLNVPALIAAPTYLGGSAKRKLVVVRSAGNHFHVCPCGIVIYQYWVHNQRANLRERMFMVTDAKNGEAPLYSDL
jgi:hypothetical protein